MLLTLTQSIGGFYNDVRILFYRDDMTNKQEVIFDETEVKEFPWDEKFWSNLISGIFDIESFEQLQKKTIYKHGNYYIFII